MNEMICFLNTHPEIKRVVFLVGKHYEYVQLRTFLKGVTLHKLILVGSLTTSTVNEIKEKVARDRVLGDIKTPELFEYADIQDFRGLGGDWALCAEWVEPEILLKTVAWKPKYLLADIWKDYISAFKIWERYKIDTSYIQIKTRRIDKEEQVLIWHKRNDVDIELSVVFPMYNVAKYLEQCIASVTEWKAPYVEFLFVNDGSPDNSREIVLKWAKRDPRIKLLDKPNGGCASARQYGLEHALGRYIGFIDPDDYIDGSMFRKLLRAAMTGSYDISYCGYNEYYEDTKKTRRVDDVLSWPYCDGTSDPKRIRDLIAYCRVAIWRGIYKREMLEGSGIHFYTDLKRFDDLPFKVETFSAAKSVIALQEHLYYYRLARPGQDVSADDERLYIHFDIFKYLNQSIASQHDQALTDQLQICKIQTHLYALRKIRPEFKEYYIKHAKEDLNTTGNFERFYEIAKKQIGIENAEYYKSIINEDVNAFINYRQIETAAH